MINAIFFAIIAAVGNALFAYGQTGAEKTKNPFIFIFGAVAVCTILFFVSSLFYNQGKSASYLLINWKYILVSGIGFFITFFGFYLLYSGFGASTYIIYAVVSIITTSIGVGVLCYHEPFNTWHFIALVLSIIAIGCFCYGQHIAKIELKEKTKAITDHQQTLGHR